MITVTDYYMKRDKEYPQELVDSPVPLHAEKLILKVNQLLEMFGTPRTVNSGWRPKAVQMKVNPKAMASKHITGDAIDLEDRDGKLKEWCMLNLDKLESIGLWLEHPSATPTWCHLQQIPPKSGNRVFYP